MVASSRVFLPCAAAATTACRSAFGPEQVRNSFKVTFHLFFLLLLQLHLPSIHPSISIIRPIPVVIFPSRPSCLLRLSFPLSLWASIPDPRPACCRFRHLADAQLDADADADADAQASTSRRENSSQSVSQSVSQSPAASQASQTNGKSVSWQGSADSASSLGPQTTADTTQPVLRRVCSRVRRRINAYMTLASSTRNC